MYRIIDNRNQKFNKENIDQEQNNNNFVKIGWHFKKRKNL